MRAWRGSKSRLCGGLGVGGGTEWRAALSWQWQVLVVMAGSKEFWKGSRAHQRAKQLKGAGERLVKSQRTGRAAVSGARKQAVPKCKG